MIINQDKPQIGKLNFCHQDTPELMFPCRTLLDDFLPYVIQSATVNSRSADPTVTGVPGIKLVAYADQYWCTVPSSGRVSLISSNA